VPGEKRLISPDPRAFSRVHDHVHVFKTACKAREANLGGRVPSREANRLITRRWMSLIRSETLGPNHPAISASGHHVEVSALPSRKVGEITPSGKSLQALGKQTKTPRRLASALCLNQRVSISRNRHLSSGGRIRTSDLRVMSQMAKFGREKMCSLSQAAVHIKAINRNKPFQLPHKHLLPSSALALHICRQCRFGGRRASAHART
jgi:hypothetical protein